MKPVTLLPEIEEPHFWRILLVLGCLIALPVVLSVLRVPSVLALPVIAASAIGGLIYGGYWTMRLVHIDRASFRRR
jgi:hypothetical protein